MCVLCVFFSCTVVQCTSNDDCSHNEACIDNKCQLPCDVHNPCAQNAVCVNVNHGSDCSCVEGYAGNGYQSCDPGNVFIYIFKFFNASANKIISQFM